MKLKEMLVGLEGLKVRGNLDIEISGLENGTTLKSLQVFLL